MKKNQAKRFQENLLRFSGERSAERRAKIEKMLWKEYGTEKVVFVLDMSGFSLLTRKHGVVHYLSMVRRMQLIAGPLIKQYNGRVIKFQADNCFAVFNETLPAIHAAIAMQAAFHASNLLTPSDLDIHISCGIDYGKILIIENKDFFGDAVNRASKLGEDVASAGEILVTDEAMQRIEKGLRIKTQKMKVSISGLEIDAHLVKYPIENEETE